MTLDPRDETLAETIRRLRRARAWPQEQLAQAAGLSLRTVQRVETGGACAHETLQALAGVLDVEVSRLLAVAPAPVEPEARWPRVRLATAVALAAPAFWFVTANAAVYELGQGWAARLLPPAEVGADRLGPWLLLAAPAAAALLVAPLIFGLRARRHDGGVVLEGLLVRRRPAPALALAVSLATVAAVLGYGLMEHLGHLARGA